MLSSIASISSNPCVGKDLPGTELPAQVGIIAKYRSLASQSKRADEPRRLLGLVPAGRLAAQPCPIALMDFLRLCFIITVFPRGWNPWFRAVWTNLVKYRANCLTEPKVTRVYWCFDFLQSAPELDWLTFLVWLCARWTISPFGQILPHSGMFCFSLQHTRTSE